MEIVQRTVTAIIFVRVRGGYTIVSANNEGEAVSG